MQPKSVVVAALLLLPSVLPLAGCGGDLEPVTGVVTLDGQPVQGSSTLHGTVMFYPESGRGAPATGMVDANGRYSIATGANGGVLPGRYRVAVDISEITPRPRGEMPHVRHLSDPRFANPTTSGWLIEVGSGSNHFDFAVDSK